MLSSQNKIVCHWITMCIIQCVDCPCCYQLTLIPLKEKYFDGGDPKRFRDWDRKDLVRRYCNAGRFYSEVSDYLCANPECPRREPDYTPALGEPADSKCVSAYCSSQTCRLVASRWEDYCGQHHPRSKKLMKKEPVFRIRIHDDDDMRFKDPFNHFMKHAQNFGGRRPFPFV